MSEHEQTLTEAIESNSNNAKESKMSTIVEKFNKAAIEYLASKGMARKFDLSKMTEDMIVRFAIEGFKGKVYRQKYNKSRWQQLKAIKDLAESRGLSVEDLLDEMSAE